MNTWEIARIVHEANRAYCQAIGDETQPPWEDAPGWQQEAAYDGVVAVLEGRVTTPGDAHANWLRHKQGAGWTWGPIKDPALKQHPCLVPFEELPAEQQVKDYLFLGLVQALLQHELMQAEAGAVIAISGDRVTSAYSFGEHPYIDAVVAGLRGMADDIEADPSAYDWIH